MAQARLAVVVRLVLLAGGLGLAVEGLVLALDPAVDLPGRHRFGTPVLVVAAALAVLAQGVAASQSIREWRVRRASGAPLRWALELFVGTASLVLIRLQPFQVPHTRYVLAVAAGVWGLALVVRALGSGREVPSAVARVELVIFNLALFLVLAEAGLRTVERVFPSPLTLGAEQAPASFLAARRRDNPAGTLYFGFPLDAKSYYDEPLASGDRRPLVVTIGDSFSYGVVPHALHYTTVAERTLQNEIRIANLGYPGAGPNEYHEILRQDGLPLAPAVVVVAVFVGNDLWELDRTGPDGTLLRTLFDRDQVRLARLSIRLWTLASEARASRKRPGEVVGSATRGVIAPARLAAKYPWLLDARLERPTFSADRYVLIETDRAEHALSPELDYTPLVESLVAMRGLVPQTPFLVALIPDELQLDDLLWASVAEQRPGLERDLPQQRLLPALGARGIAVLDFLPLLRAECAAAHGEGRCYHLRDTHWNARGNCVAGRALGAALADLLGIAGPDPGVAAQACRLPSPGPSEPTHPRG